MAGKVFFRRGSIHFTRYGGKANITDEQVYTLRSTLHRALGRSFNNADFLCLIRSILIARSEAKGHSDQPTRKDMIAQLRAMNRLGDEDLIAALRGCDKRTFEAIQQAQIDAISKLLWEEGQFTDAEGIEHRMPTQIELIGQAERCTPYLPMGCNGVRASIASVLSACEASPDQAGNREKRYQLSLSRECVIWWKKYGPPDKQKAWRTLGTGGQSGIVDFAAAVYEAAGMPLASSRLVALLKKSN